MAKEIVIASHNAGKVREIEALLAPFAMQVHSAAAFSLPEPIEDGDSFEANAAIKARSAYTHSHLTSLADDSGLVVPALNGDPGIYSARWAGENKDFSVAMQRVHDALIAKQVEPEGTKAYFVCVLALATDVHMINYFRGEVHGTLTFPPRGTMGFGYDPIFIPEGYTQTFAEIEAIEKQSISHRANAFAQFVEYIEKQRSVA